MRVKVERCGDKNSEATFISVFDWHSRKLVSFLIEKIVFRFKQETYLLSLRSFELP